MTSEKWRAYSREYYWRNRNQINERRRNRYQTDPDYRQKILEFVRQRYKSHVEAMRSMTDDEFLELCREYWGQ